MTIQNPDGIAVLIWRTHLRCRAVEPRLFMDGVEVHGELKDAMTIQAKPGKVHIIPGQWIVGLERDRI